MKSTIGAFRRTHKLWARPGVEQFFVYVLPCCDSKPAFLRVLQSGKEERTEEECGFLYS